MSEFQERHNADIDKLKRYKENLQRFNTNPRYPLSQLKRTKRSALPRTMGTRKTPLEPPTTGSLDISNEQNEELTYDDFELSLDLQQLGEGIQNLPDMVNTAPPTDKTHGDVFLRDEMNANHDQVTNGGAHQIQSEDRVRDGVSPNPDMSAAHNLSTMVSHYQLDNIK